MKLVRNILLLIALMFGFIMQAEIFQNELWNFDAAYYRASRYTVAEADESAFCDALLSSAEKHGVSVFATDVERLTNINNTLHVYGNDASVRKSLYETMRLEETRYVSLLGGVTDVKFHDFKELFIAETPYAPLICYIGDDEGVDAVYGNLSARFSLTAPEYWASTEHDMITIVWGLIALLMIVMNGIDAIRRQKETVIRRSFGESEYAIIAKASVLDIVSYAALFIAAKLLTARFVNGEYGQKLVLAIYAGGAVISLTPYAAFLTFDIRKAFTNAQDNGVLYKSMYALKFAAFTACIFTLATNMSTIRGNLVSSGEFLAPYFDCYYYGVLNAGDGTDTDAFWAEVNDTEYDILHPVVCLSIFNDDTREYILVNENAEEMLQGFAPLAEEHGENADFVIMVPDGRGFEVAMETARSLLEGLIPKAAEVVYIPYDKGQVFSYLDGKATDGIAEAVNPVVIYQKNDDMRFGWDIGGNYWNGSVLYRCSPESWKAVLDKHGTVLGSYRSVVTNARDDYDYRHSFLVKLIGFLSSLCIVVILLDATVVIVMNRMEFRRSAMEISLKKVLGYGFAGRYRKMLLAFTAMNLLSVLIICVLSLFMNNMPFVLCVIIGLAASVSELAVMGICIVSVEKTGVPKSLKGGCL